MSLTKTHVEHVADLARITVQPEEANRLVEELNQILAFVEQLNQVDTSGIRPMTGVTDSPLRTRPDNITDGDIPDQILANAPEQAEGYFVVPKVIE